MTGSGKTAAFLLPILQRLLERAAAARPARWCSTPTRELAAQILEHLNALAVHTPVTARGRLRRRRHGAAGARLPQPASTSSSPRPGRLLDHMQQPYAQLDGLEVLVLDEADRMLDMGFLPDIRRILRHLPRARQTLFFSATMPPPIVDAGARDAARPGAHQPSSAGRRRPSASRQAVYPVPQELKSALLRRARCSEASIESGARLHPHQAPRQPAAEFLEQHGVTCRAHPRQPLARRSARRRSPASRTGRFRVLVATDIAARGIDVEALGHVVNFDVPARPEDYIHRVGRTARAAATGDAFTFASPDEDGELRGDRAGGRQAARRAGTVPDFDYRAAAGAARGADRRSASPRSAPAKAEERAARAGQRRAPSPGAGRSGAAAAAPPGLDESEPTARPRHRRWPAGCRSPALRPWTPSGARPGSRGARRGRHAGRGGAPPPTPDGASPDVRSATRFSRSRTLAIRSTRSGGGKPLDQYSISSSPAMPPRCTGLRVVLRAARDADPDLAGPGVTHSSSRMLRLSRLSPGSRGPPR